MTESGGGFEVLAETESAQGAELAHRLIHGDSLDRLGDVTDGSCRLVLTSPPYNIGKEYERDQRLSLTEYLAWVEPIIEKLLSKVSTDGHLCWQSGNYIENGEVFPLDYYFY